MTNFQDLLSTVSRLFFDTSPIIYFVEAHPTYDALLIEAFQLISQDRIVGVTSTLTLTEVLIHPLRVRATELSQQYRDFLTNSTNFELRIIDSSVAERAAELRARYRFLRTPDALQLSVALNT